MVRALIRFKNPIINRLMLWYDDILGYGRSLSKEDFWGNLI